jgi:hypothetical protein
MTRESAYASVEASVPEFRDYVDRFGTAYVAFGLPEGIAEIAKPICVGDDCVFGFALGRRILLLPCTVPQRHDQVLETVTAAIQAAIAYRRRISTALPTWVKEFVFGQEKTLIDKVQKLREEVEALEIQIGVYDEFKGVLCWQSDPLVKAVSDVLQRFCGIKLVIDEKCIEDGTIRDEADRIEAVIEIKGVKGNFKRSNVNQVDAHRERLSLATNTPGILIMNTLMEASSLREKDQSPHPDVISKAVTDHVLMLRTLDLLRFADGVERAVFKTEDMRRLMLSEAGWLRVEGDTIQICRD